MSKQSSLLCVVCVLVVLLLAGDQYQLVAAQIGDEFLCQDPIRAPSILMPSHATGRNELNSNRAPPAALTQEEDVVVVGEDKAFSGNEYEEEEALFVGGERARDPDRSTDEEEDEENSLLAGEAAVAEVSNNSEEHGSSGGVECPECGKHFRSDKSMFGHLRSHPDRGYKGSTPLAKRKLLPSHDAASPPPPAVCPVARYSQRDPNLNTFEILAAYVMLTLKTRGNPPAHDQSLNVKSEPDVPPKKEGSVMSKVGDDVTLGDKNGSSVATKKVGDDTVRHTEHGSSYTEMAGGDDTVHRSEHGSSAAEMAGDDHRLLCSEQGIVEEVPTTKRGRTKKSKEAAHKKEKDALSASKGRRPYICKHCNAVFPTHQALGGHMAAHNKDRRVQAQHEQATAAWEAHHQGQSSLNRQEPKGAGGGEEHGPGGLSASARALLMERYTRLFNSRWQSRQETGGGYKRQHTGREDAGSLPPVAPLVADGDGRRLFGVDLNVRAPGQE